MSGFFSLGGNKDHQEQDHHHPTDNNNNINSLFLFKNEEIYNKGFELWQQYSHLHQQRQNHPHNIQDVDFSVGPSRRNNNINSGNNNIGDESSSYRPAGGCTVMRELGRGGNEGINCQDCGNQPKKDCAHLRCRTCFKSRGFHCQTHVKSTWVPAAKRRERQQQLTALQQDHQQQETLAVGRRENLKRLRENPVGGGSPLGCTTSRLPATTPGFELGHFPAEVNSPAVFRCVRVSAVDDAEEHLAYQMAVNIGGHVFKGILYYQGSESRYTSGEGSTGCRGSRQQPLSLMAAAAGDSHQNMTILDPSIYPTPLNSFMAGTQFFPPPRP